MELLKRNFTFHRQAGQDDALSGYAFKYSETADGFFGKEKFSENLQVEFNKDVFLFRDHSPQRLLGKVGKNMTVKTDDQGLYFCVSPLPDTPLAKETKTLVKDGLLTGASVGFSVLSERTEDKVNIFEKIKLYEISLTPQPYYQSSQIEARANKVKNIKPPELYL